jgi:hypothetical protein
MRVQIAGSLNFDGASDVEDAYKDACKAIGVALGASGMHLVLGSDKEKVAARYVFNGFTSANEHGQIFVVCSDSGQTPYAAERTEHQIIYRRRKGPWASVRVHQVLQADVVLAIGGRHGTTLVSQTAVALEKPVLAIPCFNGAAKELFEEFERDYREIPDASSDLGLIRESWSDEHPQAILRLLRNLHRHNPFVHRRLAPVLGLLAASAVLLTGWLLLIQRPLGNFLNNVFGLLAISVLLGTILRYGLRQFTNPATRISLSTLAIHAAVGLILGFGLTLAYMLGGLGITGSWEFLNRNAPGDLLRVGVVLSTLGLTAGFLLEASENRLRSWLQRFVEE